MTIEVPESGGRKCAKTPNSPARSLWAVDLVPRWTAYSGGRLSAAEEAARLLEEASGADLRFFQERIATRVAQLYFEFSARKVIVRSDTAETDLATGQAAVQPTLYVSNRGI